MVKKKHDIQVSLNMRWYDGCPWDGDIGALRVIARMNFKRIFSLNGFTVLVLPNAGNPFQRKISYKNRFGDEKHTDTTVSLKMIKLMQKPFPTKNSQIVLTNGTPVPLSNWKQHHRGKPFQREKTPSLWKGKQQRGKPLQLKILYISRSTEKSR